MAEKNKLKSQDVAEPAVNEGEGSSGTRMKRPPVAPAIQAMYDAFAARTKGMSAEDLDREVDLFIDEIVERNLAAAPAGLRDQMRETVRGFVQTNPHLTRMVEDLRAATARG